MASAGIGRLSTDEAFLRTGILIDMCGAPRRKAGIARALAWCDELEARDLSAAERGQLDYFRANAWNTCVYRKRHPGSRSGAKGFRLAVNDLRCEPRPRFCCIAVQIASAA
jgi:hypothetical protein